jgi:hypothetical protein
MKSMKIGKQIAAALILMSLVGCSQEVMDGNSSTIRFSMGGRIDLTTRGIIDQALVNSENVPVRVTATRGGSTLYSNERLYRDEVTSEWLPRESSQQDWEAGVRHTFIANAYSPDTAVSSGALTISSPTSITVTQPDTYDSSSKDGMVDYLLSQNFIYTVPVGSQPPIVRLEMEHAMSLVEINIAKHVSFENVNVYLEEVRLEGFYRSAKMECPTPAQYGNVAGETNSDVWQYWVMGSTDAIYEINGANPYPSVTADCVPLKLKEDEGGVRMCFLAPPQQLESSCRLYVSYWVNEKYSDESLDNYVYHQSTFNLFNYATSGGLAIWLPGHHVVYTLEVDTGIHIEGTISPWIDVDYIEGTVLPDVTDPY